MWKLVVLYIISLLFSNILAEVTLTVSSVESKTLYQNEAAALSCSATLDEEAFGNPSEVTIKLGANEVGCFKSRSGWSAFSKPPSGGTFDSYTLPSGSCEAIMASPYSFKMDVVVNLSVEGSYSCEVYSSASDQDEASAPMDVSDLRVAPKELTIAVAGDTDKIIDGDTISVSCSSVDGEPTSKFVYGLDQEDGTATSTFTMTTGERNVWCFDEAHEDYHGGKDGKDKAIYASKSISVYGLELSTTQVAPVLNPTASTLLDCSISARSLLPEDKVPTFSWAKDGAIIDGQNDPKLEVPLDNENTVESSNVTYMCNVSVQSTSLNITLDKSRHFPVMWSGAATIPTTTSTTTVKPVEKPDDGKQQTQAGIDAGVIAAIVIAVIVVLIIIIVIVVCVKRRSGKSKEMKTENRATPKDKDEEEKGDPNANKSGSTAPMVKEAERE